MKKITLELTSKSINSAIRQLEKLDKEWDRKVDTLLKKVAKLGAKKASVGFSKAAYDGNNDVDVTVEKIDNGYVIKASGEAVLFVEFGAGVTYGYGHPEPMQYGPGTYPSEKGRRSSADGKFYKNWEHPNGWYLPKSAGGGKSYGNPPSATMYHTARELEDEILQIAREVFNGA